MEKITNPGRKSVHRIYDASGHAVCDLIAHEGEEIDLSEPFRAVDPVKPWKTITLEGCTSKSLLKKVVSGGKRVNAPKDLKEIRAYVQKQLDEEIWQEEQRFENPHIHHMDMTPSYYAFKMDLLRRGGNPSEE